MPSAKAPKAKSLEAACKRSRKSCLPLGSGPERCNLAGSVCYAKRESSGTPTLVNSLGVPFVLLLPAIAQVANGSCNQQCFLGWLNCVRSELKTLIQRLANVMAAERGRDPAEGAIPEGDVSLEGEAIAAADEFSFRTLNGETMQPSTLIETLLVEIYEIDGQIFDLLDGETPPPGEMH